MTDCIFCKIGAGEIPTDYLYEDDDLVAFRDLNPHAPLHVLVIPKKHISTINDIQEEDAPIVGKMIRVAAKIAKEHGYDESGFRLTMNCNDDGGQTVFHIHLHLLAGRQLHWPPG